MRKICLLIVYLCAFAAWADDYVVLSPSFVPQALLARQIARFCRKFDRLQKMSAFQKLKKNNTVVTENVKQGRINVLRSNVPYFSFVFILNT